MTEPPDLVDADAAAPLVPCNAKRLRERKWRTRWRIPHYTICGRILFSVRELDEWRARQRVTYDGRAS